MQSIWIKFILFVFLCGFFFVVNAQEKNQQAFKKNMASYSSSFSSHRIYGPEASSFLSTVIPNALRVKGKSLSKYGFKTHFIKNKAGLITKVHIKSDGTKKPLLVFVSGLSGSSQSASFKRYALPLARNSSYHIALVENSTHKAWIRRNQNLLFTGFEAGVNLYLLLKEFKNYIPRYSSLSVIAFSLGGHDSAYAAYLDTINGTKIIDGPLLFWSSPIEKLSAIKQLRSKRGRYKFIVKILLEPIYEQLVAMDKSFSEKSYKWFAHKGSFLEIFNGFLKKSIVKNTLYLSKFNESFDLLKLQNSIKKDKNLLGQHSLCQLLPKVKKPILWIHAMNDPVVDYSLTEECLINLHQSNLDYVLSRYGGHVGFDFTYGKRKIRKITKDYLDYWLSS